MLLVVVEPEEVLVVLDDVSVFIVVTVWDATVACAAASLAAAAD